VKNIVVNTLSGFIEVLMWLTLLGGAVVGFQAARFPGAIATTILGVIVAFIIDVIVFGVLAVILEIRNYLKTIAELLQAQGAALTRVSPPPAPSAATRPPQQPARLPQQPARPPQPSR
jgi:hypothetical protein